ncbi:hypothetical protein E4U55_001988, partial [Claviceps digitariae]
MKWSDDQRERRGVLSTEELLKLNELDDQLALRRPSEWCALRRPVNGASARRRSANDEPWRA